MNSISLKELCHNFNALVKKSQNAGLAPFLQGLGAFCKVRAAAPLKIKARLLAASGKPTHQLQHAQNSLKKSLALGFCKIQARWQ